MNITNVLKIFNKIVQATATKRNNMNIFNGFKNKKPEMKDPVRFPKVINGFEGVAKKMYNVTLQKNMIEINKILKGFEKWF